MIEWKPAQHASTMKLMRSSFAERETPLPRWADSKGSAVELHKTTSDKGSLSATAPAAPEAPAAETDTRGGIKRAEVEGGEGVPSERGEGSFVRAVGCVVQVSGLRPCTTYRLMLEMPALVRHDLLESARYKREAFRMSDSPVLLVRKTRSRCRVYDS